MTLGFLLAGMMAAACGPGASSPTPLVRASQPSSSRTPPPTALATASAESSETPFASSVYPYTLQLPSGVAHRNWRPATRPWRTDERIDSVAAFNDANGAADGSIFILGAAWDGTLESFRDLIATNVSRFHGCSAPNGLRSATVAGEPAFAFTSRCGNGVLAARVVVVHAGFGLDVNVSEISDSREGQVLDDILGWLRGLTWRNP
jgi:hypothetical protein